MQNKELTLAIFASDKGAGDSERAEIMSQAGSFLATKGASFVCLAQDGVLCTPFIISARSIGAKITIIADEGFLVPKKLNNIAVERFALASDRYKRIGELSGAFIGLPGSLLSTKALFEAYILLEKKLPILLLNKNKSFEFMRGFALDVMSHKIKNIDKHLQHADNVEDIWSRLSKMI